MNLFAKIYIIIGIIIYLTSAARIYYSVRSINHIPAAYTYVMIICIYGLPGERLFLYGRRTQTIANPQNKYANIVGVACVFISL